MIPVSATRIGLVLLGISVLVAGVDYALIFIGLRGRLLLLCMGAFTGILVALMAMEGGLTLRFCAKGVLKAAQSRRVDEAMARLGCQNLEIRVSVIDARRLFAVTVPEGCGHRLFVSNFLIMTFTPEALRGVLAHEYGHMRQKHPAKQAVLLGLVAGVKMTAGIPLLAGLAILFLYLWMLREWEFIADSEALRLAGSESLKKAFHEYHVVSGDTVEASLVSEIFSGHPSFARRWARIAGR
mgnify:CR=1 FL=1